MCSIYNSSRFWLTCSNSFLKLGTFDGWLSQTIALKRKLQFERISRESKSSVLSQFPSLLVSGDDIITYGIDSFKPTTMKQTMALYSSSLSSKPIISSPKYSRLFCKSISSKIRYTSSEKFRSICNAFAYLNAPIVPLLISRSNDKDGNGKSLSKIYLYDWIDVYFNNKLYALGIAKFRLQYDQCFPSFSYFADLFRRVK